MDYALADGAGSGLCYELKSRPAPPGVLIYSGFAHEVLYVPARAAGADGLMGKGAPAEELFEAIRSLASRRLRAPLATREARTAGSARLDRADLPILGMLSERVPHADIAEVLGLTATELDRRIRRFLARRATAARRTN